MGITLPTTKSRPVSQACEIIMIYGAPSVGKTTLVNGMGKILFLSTDRGTRFMESMSVPIHDWKDVQDVISLLKKNPKTLAMYDGFCFDHIDDIFNFCDQSACEALDISDPSDLEWGKGWKAIKQSFVRTISDFLSFNKPIYFIAHEQTRTVKTRTLQLDKTSPYLSKTAAKVLFPLCEVIAYVYAQPNKDQNGGNGQPEEARYLTTKLREDLYAKHRPQVGPAYTIKLDPAIFRKRLNGDYGVASKKEVSNGKADASTTGQESPLQPGKLGRRAR